MSNPKSGVLIGTVTGVNRDGLLAIRLENGVILENYPPTELRVIEEVPGVGLAPDAIVEIEVIAVTVKLPNGAEVSIPSSYVVIPMFDLDDNNNYFG